MSRTLLFVVNVDWAFLTNRLPIALEAMRQGYRVHIATGLTDKLDELQRNGLVVHPLALDRSSTGLGNAWRTMVQLWQIFRVVRPDVVHLVTIKPVLLGGLVARLAGVPAVVAAVPGLGFVFMAQGAKAAIRRYMVELLYRVAFGHHNLKVIFQNTDDLRSLAKVTHLPKTKMTLIRGSGVDLAQYVQVPLPDGVPVVILAARLLADKGVLEFVQAARLLRQRGCNARFVLVGTVDMANPTSFTDAEVSAWVHDGMVEWWGHRADMPQVLATAQVVVLPSYYGEGLPKVLIEAAACGRVVVTTDLSGCRDAIEPGVTGVLVPVRNAVALADAMEDLINDPLRCQVMGDAGRALAERAFDVRQVVAAHLRIYSELIGKVVPAPVSDLERVDISISVVSHSQLGLIVQLLADLEQHCRGLNFELLLTLNLNEKVLFSLDAFSYPIRIIRNTTPKGFGANHNQAFTRSTGHYFCVINPDIRLNNNPFSTLLAGLEDSSVGLVAPLALGRDGEVENSARRFPSPLKILRKALGRGLGPDYVIKDTPIYPDWVGGMFMLFPRAIFERLGGFDQRYFLYYEDVDICARLRLLGYEVVLCPKARVTHDAQRSSHGSYKYFRWHIKSMTRFFLSPTYWRLTFPSSR